METLFIVLQVIACILLIASVLLQPAKSGGGLVLSSGNSNVQGSKDFHPLFKPCMYIAIFLLASSLFLSWMKIDENKSSVVDSNSLTTTPSIKQESTPTESKAVPPETKSKAE